MASKKADKRQPQKKQGDKFTLYLVIGMITLVVLAGVGAVVAKNHAASNAPLPSSVSKANGYGITFNPTTCPQVQVSTVINVVPGDYVYDCILQGSSGNIVLGWGTVHIDAEVSR